MRASVAADRVGNTPNSVGVPVVTKDRRSCNCVATSRKTKEHGVLVRGGAGQPIRLGLAGRFGNSENIESKPSAVARRGRGSWIYADI
jgi:hypothetical protein